jgi:uncharacterized membrane protein YdjX (TVP38/TMEM64 family)
MKKLNNKGSAYWMLYSFAFGFLLIMMFMIFNQILQVYIYPTTQYLTTDLATTTARADKYLGFWELVPYILLFLVLLFLFIKSTQKTYVQQGE